MLPGDEPLVVKAVGQPGGLQDAWGVFEDAVPAVLDAVLAVADGVLPMQDGGEPTLVVVALALGFGQAGVPAVELLLRDGQGVGAVQGVDPGPVEAVARGFQGVDDDAVREGVLRGDVPAVQEGIGRAEAFRDLHRVACIDARNGVGVLHGHPEEVETVVRKVFQDGVLLRGVRFPEGILRNRILAEGVQPDLPEHPDMHIGPDGTGGFHPHRSDDREPRDDGGHDDFRPQVLHTNLQI